MNSTRLGTRCLIFLSLVLPPSAFASEANLKRFFSKVDSYTSHFAQVVLDEGFNPIEETTGTMWISRPGKFRWDYDPPTEQQIISDGKKVFLYDIDLEQVTVRSVDKALGKTPAILLAGKGDLKAQYDVRDLGTHGSLQWVGLRPKDKDSSFEDIRIGFEQSKLSLMELIDGLGQTTRISFVKSNENPDIKAGHFDFAPPEGIDIIDESAED